MCMPKLEDIHLIERLRARLADLKADKEVALRELRALLNEEQIKAIDDAWAYQQQLRKTTKARTKEKQIELGYKSKRDIHIEVYENAISELDVASVFQNQLKKLEVKRAKTYLDEYFAATKKGIPRYQAESIANNALTRAHLRRYDGADNKYRNKRDKEIAEMESSLKKQLGIKDDEEDSDT